MSGFGDSKSTNSGVVKAGTEAAETFEEKTARIDRELAEGRKLIESIYGGGSYTTPSTFETVEKQVLNPNYKAPVLTPVDTSLSGALTGGTQQLFSQPTTTTTGGTNHGSLERRVLGFDNVAPTTTTNYDQNTRRLFGLPSVEEQAAAAVVPKYITQTSEVETPGETTEYAGFGDDFYNAFLEDFYGYYTPQLQDAYVDARSATNFDLARKGISRSSAAVKALSDLEEDRLDQETSLASRGDAEVANLKADVQTSKSNAYNQLELTEDPTLTVNNALSEVNAIRDTSPTYSPLGDVFNSAALGYQSYQDSKTNANYRQYAQPKSPYNSSGRTVS